MVNHLERDMGDTQPVRHDIVIYSIRPFGGLVAGEDLYYELRGPHGIMTVRDSATVSRITKAMTYAKKFNHDVRDYVAWILNNE